MPRQSHSGLPDGITARHRRGCANAGHTEWRCGCPPRYQVQVWSRRDQRRLSRTFPKLAAAKTWKRDAERSLEAGELLAATSGRTIRQAGEALIEGMRSGGVRTRSGRIYKPSAIRTFKSNLELHIYPALGPYRLQDVRRGEVQRLADRLLSTGRSPSTIRNALMPLRVIYRRGLSLEEVTINPTSRLDLPAVEGTRDRFRVEGEIELKSGRGRRDIPISRTLRRQLLAHLAQLGWRE